MQGPGYSAINIEQEPYTSTVGSIDRGVQLQAQAEHAEVVVQEQFELQALPPGQVGSLSVQVCL